MQEETVPPRLASSSLSLLPKNPTTAPRRVGRLSPAPGIIVREHPDRAVTSQFLRDLGLPLAAMTTLLEMVDEGALPEPARAALVAVAENASYAQDLLRDFANLQELEAGTVRVNPQRVTLQRWLDAALQRCTQRPAGASPGLSVSFASLLPSACEFDAGLADAAVDAVLRVACERAGRGPVHLRIAYLSAATGAPSRLSVQVRTLGGGFGEIDQSYAFVPFVAQDQNHRPQLGLCLARRWSELLGGSLSVESPGMDSCTYELSLVAPPAPGATWYDPLEPQNQDFGPVGIGRLVFAGELADTLLLAEPSLRRAGFVPSTAVDLDGCLRQVREGRAGISGVVLSAELGAEGVAALRGEGFPGPVVVLDGERTGVAKDHVVLPRTADASALLHALRSRR